MSQNTELFMVVGKGRYLSAMKIKRQGKYIVSRVRPAPCWMEDKRDEMCISFCFNPDWPDNIIRASAKAEG